MRGFNPISFVIGILAGGIVSGSVVYYALSDDQNATDDATETNLQVSAEPLNIKPSFSGKKTSKDVVVQNIAELEMDSLSVDSLSLDSLNVLETIKDTIDQDIKEEVFIATEYLVETSYIELQVLDTLQSSLSIADSLLLDDLNMEKPSSPEEISIEKWHSPINYKGYKFNRTKLVLYSFVGEEVRALIEEEGGFLLKTSLKDYHLILTEELISLR